MKRRIVLAALIIIVAVICIAAICEIRVSYSSKDRLYDKIEDIPHRKVGLVLGTSPISTWTGKRNFYFDCRINAAVKLYKAGNVDWLVVSGGDYRNENGFDEPVAMRDSLMRQGVDSTRIVLDYDGFRTLNSIAKMRDVYHQDSIIIISQRYHNERALYQANHLGIDAIAFNAEAPEGIRSPKWWVNRGREVLARVKVCWEMKTDKKIIFRDTLNQIVEKYPFPYNLQEVLIWDDEWEDCHGQETMGLTDSLHKRILIFVDRDPNYIVYRMGQLGCFNDSLEYDLMTIMNDGYDFTPEDKKSLADYLCKFTAVYNEVGTRFRYMRYNGKWPY